MTIMDVWLWVLAAVAVIAWGRERFLRRMTEGDLQVSREATNIVRSDWAEECDRNRRLRYGVAPFLHWSRDIVSEFGPQSDAMQMADGGLTVGACRRLVQAADEEGQ